MEKRYVAAKPGSPEQMTTAKKMQAKFLSQWTRDPQGKKRAAAAKAAVETNDTASDLDEGKKWIAGAIAAPGALKKQLKAKGKLSKGEEQIPAKTVEVELKKESKKPGATVYERRLRLAKTLRKMGKKGK